MDEPFQAFHSPLSTLIHFTHGPNGFLNKGVLIFLNSDDSTQVVEHGPFFFSDDIVIKSGNERLLVGGGIPHVMSFILVVVFKR